LLRGVKERESAFHSRWPSALALADLNKSLRASLCYLQALRHKVKSLLEKRSRRKPI
jgi:hypothetical protein